MVNVDIRGYDQSDLTGFLGCESPVEYGEETFIGTSIWMIFFSATNGRTLGTTEKAIVQFFEGYRFSTN